MLEIKKAGLTPQTAAELENAMAQEARNTANIEYLSMMAGIDLELSLNENKKSVEIKAIVSCDGKTGVEMEALTAVSTAALTVYDMCKAVQKDIVISDIRLLKKSGGVHGDFLREE